MNKQYLEEQIILLLSGEKTEISEDIIRSEISDNPELQTEYAEISTLLGASQKTTHGVTSERWAKFMIELHMNLEKQRNDSTFIKLAEFFSSPVKVTAAASIVAALIIGLVLLFSRTIEDEVVVEKNESYEPAYANLEEIESIDQIDRSFIAAESIIPSDEELAVVENAYAVFRSHDENDANQDIIESEDIEIEELKQYYISDGNEDMS